MNPVSYHQNLGNTNQSGDKQLKSHVLDNFKKVVLKVAVKSSKNKSLVGSQTVILEKHLDELLPRLSKRPDHIPYSAMIEKAVRQLDDGQRGSTNEAVSNFIKKTYVGLPYFHDELLKHHLVEVCKKGDIAQNNDSSYYSNSFRSKRSTIPSSLSKMSISEPKNSRGFEESIAGSSSNPCNDKRPTMEAIMEADRKGKKKEKSVIGTTTRPSNMEAKRKRNGNVVKPVGRRTRSSIKRIGI